MRSIKASMLARRHNVQTRKHGKVKLVLNMAATVTMVSLPLPQLGPKTASTSRSRSVQNGQITEMAHQVFLLTCDDIGAGFETGTALAQHETVNTPKELQLFLLTILELTANKPNVPPSPGPQAAQESKYKLLVYEFLS